MLHKTVGQGWGPWGMIPTSPWNLNKNYLLANFFCSFHIILLLFYCSLNDNSFINTVFFLIISVFIIYLDNDKKINKTITLQFQIILPRAYQSLDFWLDASFLVLTPPFYWFSRFCFEDISEIVKTDCSFWETVSSLV